VLGTACGVGIEGSGWVAARGLVVTNAHVVAGETDTVIQVGGQPPDLDAQVVDFDPNDDIAVLRVPGLTRPVLPLAGRASSGTPGAILGYPEDGPFTARAARIGQTETVRTEDAYGTGTVVRSVTALRGLVQPGNSGGPVVDSSGRVLATVFAAITGSAQKGGFAVPNELVQRQLAIAESRGTAVSSGHCAG
jgi:S1-C subfamily serine protease